MALFCTAIPNNKRVLNILTNLKGYRTIVLFPLIKVALQGCSLHSHSSGPVLYRTKRGHPVLNTLEVSFSVLERIGQNPNRKAEAHSN